MKQDLYQGAKATLPVAFSVAAYGSVLGVLAAQRQLPWEQLLFMNVSIFAGSAQFVMIDMWNHPLPIVEIAIAVCIINLRYILIGASLRELFSGKSLVHKLSVMHFVADENWAVTLATHRSRPVSTYFLLGGGLCLVTAWSAGTLLGHRLGEVIRNPEAYALDFAFIAVFTALAMGMWQGRKSIIPWAVAALLAILAEHMLPGKWYMLIGGVGGALVAALITDPKTEKTGDEVDGTA